MPGQLGMIAASAGAGGVLDLWQQILQEQQERRQVGNSKELMKYQNQLALEMWEKTGYGAQMKQLKAAGLNPGLLYGMGGGGGQSTGNAGATAGMSGARSNVGEMAAMGLQMGLMKAQKENIEADTLKKKTEATKIGGPDTENVKADTENKILAGIIAKYTGMEMKDVYEKISSQENQRYAQSKAAEGENLGKAAIGYQLWRMHENGELNNKSMAEIEEILLKNAKTREERNLIIKQIEALEKTMKGTDLENALKEIDVEMTKKLGLDRNSNDWMRIIGRLFLKLTGL